MGEDGRPILVTGAHRSGTTWVGEMLCASGEAGYIYEPFNPNHLPKWLGISMPWFQYVCAANESSFDTYMTEVIRFRLPRLRQVRIGIGLKSAGAMTVQSVRNIGHRLCNRRALVKDPCALFAAPWIADRFDASVVVLVRHPAAFVSSLKRLGWRFDVRNLLDQELLMKTELREEVEMIRSCESGSRDLIDEAIVLWKVVYGFVNRQRAAHSDWLFVRHEDLARDAVGGFRTLYGHLSLRFDRQVEDIVLEGSTGRRSEDIPVDKPMLTKRDSRSAAESWKSRLTADEIARVREGVGELGGVFYEDESWV